MVDPAVDREDRMRVRAFQAILAAIAVLGAAGALALEGGNTAAAATTGVVSAALAVAIEWMTRRAWATVWHVLTGLATVAVTVLAIAGDGSAISTAAAVLYVWVGVHAAVYLPRRGAGIHLAVAAAGYALALTLVGVRAPAAAWGIVVLTLVVGAGVVGWLSDQNRQLGRTDPLTGTANRRYWEHTVAHECARAARSGDPLCVVVVSIDGFREYAYERGQAAGELLLREAGAAWSRCVRGGDLIGRLGSEQFGILLPECGVSVARLVTDRVRAATPDTKTCSAGIAVWDAQEPPDVLINRAVAALRTAQGAGKAQSFVSAA